MPIKRSRTARSCAYLEEEALSNNVERPPVEQSSTSIAAPNKAARTSMTVDHVVNPPVQQQPQPQLHRDVIISTASPQPPLVPPQVQQQIGDDFLANKNPLLPPTFLDVCNYCKKRIPPNQDMYMNGGLEAYCSPECRDDFNNIMNAAGKQSPEPGSSSMAHFQWKKNN